MSDDILKPDDEAEFLPTFGDLAGAVPDSVKGKKFEHCPFRIVECEGPTAGFIDIKKGKCMRCSLADQASKMGGLMCECLGCKAFFLMKKSDKTTDFIEDFRKKNGFFTICAVEKSTCPECSPKFSKERRDRKKREDKMLKRAEIEYQKSLKEELIKRRNSESTASEP